MYECSAAAVSSLTQYFELRFLCPHSRLHLVLTDWVSIVITEVLKYHLWWLDSLWSRDWSVTLMRWSWSVSWSVSWWWGVWRGERMLPAWQPDLDWSVNTTNNLRHILGRCGAGSHWAAEYCDTILSTLVSTTVTDSACIPPPPTLPEPELSVTPSWGQQQLSQTTTNQEECNLNISSYFKA